MTLDPLASYWLQQVENRLRREITWQQAEPGRPLLNRRQKEDFFRQDPTALHLTKGLMAKPEIPGEALSGTLSWLAAHWSLAPVECWLVGLALFAFKEGSAGTLFAESLGRKTPTPPTLQLAQLLWDHPEEVLVFLDAAQRVRRSGLISLSGSGWDAVISIPPVVARSLLGLEPLVPLSLRYQEEDPEGSGGALALMAVSVVARLEEAWAQAEYPWVKVASHRQERTSELALAVSGNCGRPVFEFLGRPEELPAVVTWAWLQGAVLVAEKVPEMELPPLPVMKFTQASAEKDLWTYPLPESTWEQRRKWFTQSLGAEAAAALAEELSESARRYRLGPKSIRAACHVALATTVPLTGEGLRQACLAETRAHFGPLAQPVQTRYRKEDLVLAGPLQQQFEEVCQAVKNTFSRAAFLENTGLTLMFAGPPGTGKSMAAEVLARRAGLPLYRIDLSQIVNKYIGETEKNLGLVFDAAEESECLLFFDEADALFGRRTEVREAHDRYANLEISYLLQRMEGFRGVVVLATNRKRDLDEAFLRRIRYVLDFAMPDQRERKRLWEHLLPPDMDRAGLDTEFLAKHFQLTGGYIRSAIQNAYCLKMGSPAALPKLEQLDLLMAIHRELEKLGRQSTADQFGPYTKAVLERIRGGDLR